MNERPVSSEQVGQYKEMVEAHAYRFSRLPLLNNSFDDLAQMGYIAVWEALKGGHWPSTTVVLNAMRDYARIERRQGFTGYDPTEDNLMWVELETVEVV